MDLLALPPSLRRTLSSHIYSLPHPKSYTTAIPAISTSSNPPPPQTTSQTTPAPSRLTLASSALNSYTTTPSPTSIQLSYASTFFTRSHPHLLFSSAAFRTLPPSLQPEVCFLGRSNVGKSSLLNALFGRPKLKCAHVSKKPGRTRTINGFGVSGEWSLGTAPRQGDREDAWKRFPRGGMVVVDMPGYGTGSREVWGREVVKYLEQRRQLRRTFVLVDAEHGLKPADVEILTFLRSKGVGYQVVLSKIDKVLFANNRKPGAEALENRLGNLRTFCDEVRHRLDEEAGDGRKGVLDMLCCSAEKSLGGQKKLGVDEIRWAVLSACGMDCDASGQRRRSRIEDFEVLREDG